MEEQKTRARIELKFCCSICLDLLKDPVTTPCGHNYCMSCIKTCWDKEDGRKTHSCPQCRQTFRPRPVLVKNGLLAELVEELKITGEVVCDVCTGEKQKASKSCLVCLASYCERHLKPHYESANFKKHKLVEPSVNLQDTVCSQHGEAMKIFCRTDQQCICIICSVDGHKGHDTASAASERGGKQAALGQSRQKLQQSIEARERDVTALQEEMEEIKGSADEAVEGSDRKFTELIRLVEERRSDVKAKVRSHQEAQESRVKELQEKLRQQIAEMRSRDAELEKLSHTEDHTQFLMSYCSLPPLTEPTSSPTPPGDHRRYFESVAAAVNTAVAAVQDKMQAIPTEPMTRTEFLHYYRCITADPNTANLDLVLSEGNRRMTKDSKPHREPPPNPERFIHSSQFLSKEELTGRCYWEVEINKSTFVAVAYKTIRRSGDYNAHVFGHNEESWALWGKSVIHNNQKTRLSVEPSSRVGVYLDHSAGILAFYNVSGTMTLLHRVQTTFTQPLYAGLYLYGGHGDTAAFCKLK